MARLFVRAPVGFSGPAKEEALQWIMDALMLGQQKQIMKLIRAFGTEKS